MRVPSAREIGFLMVFVASSNDGNTGAAVEAVIQQLRERAAAGAPTDAAPRLQAEREVS